jgi:putative Mg2+ transporter-C (MgtC) family protein
MALETRAPQSECGSVLELLGLAHPLAFLPHMVALVVAYLLAFPIGWNREKEERSAGLRTFPLVAIASCGFIQAAQGLTADNPEAMARIVEGIITGMGFIGGGAILRLKDSVKGTATAASLWATGAIGTAVGLGSYAVAIILCLVTMLTLWLLTPLKHELDGEAPAEEGEAGPGKVVDQVGSEAR